MSPRSRNEVVEETKKRPRPARWQTAQSRGERQGDQSTAIRARAVPTRNRIPSHSGIAGIAGIAGITGVTGISIVSRIGTVPRIPVQGRPGRSWDIAIGIAGIVIGSRGGTGPVGEGPNHGSRRSWEYRRLGRGGWGLQTGGLISHRRKNRWGRPMALPITRTSVVRPATGTTTGPGTATGPRTAIAPVQSDGKAAIGDNRSEDRGREGVVLPDAHRAVLTAAVIE